MIYVICSRNTFLALRKKDTTMRAYYGRLSLTLFSRLWTLATLQRVRLPDLYL